MDSFGLSDLRTSKYEGASTAVGTASSPLELDPMGTELWSQLPSGSPIEPETPMEQNQSDDWISSNNPNYYNRGIGGVASPACAVGNYLMDCSRVYFADGFGNSVFGSLERAVRTSVQQTGWRYRYETSRGQLRTEDLPFETSRTYLENLLAEGGTLTPLYNNWAVLPNEMKDWWAYGFDKNQKEIINNQVKSMYSNDKCSAAFEAAGLKSVRTMMDSANMAFVREGALDSPSNTDEWGGDENLRSQTQAKFRKSVYRNGVTPVNGYNGKYFVFLRNRAFGGDDDTPVNVIIHELIHAGGMFAGNDKITDTYVMPIPFYPYRVVITRQTKTKARSRIYGGKI